MILTCIKLIFCIACIKCNNVLTIMTVHYTLHISQPLYSCHHFKVFLFVFHSLCSNLCSSLSLQIQSTAPFSLFCPQSCIVLYCIKYWIVPSHMLHFSKNYRVFWSHRVWWRWQGKCFILTRADYPQCKRRGHEKKRNRDVYRAVWAASPIWQFRKRMEWEGWGKEKWREREWVCVCIWRGGFLCGREKVAERAHRRRGGVYVCVHWSVCVCV